MIRRSLAAAAAVALAALTLVPAGPADARAVPGPRSEEWWFPAWDIQNKVWPLTHGAGVKVALIDSGVNASLPGLSDAVLSGINLDDHGGDGRTDTDTAKGAGHGTAMAELIAGQGQDLGMVGVAPEAKILPIVAGRYSFQVAPAIRWAVDHGAKVINISEGFPDAYLGHHCPGDVLSAAIYAAQKDVVVVASSGNEGNTTNRMEWPADCGGVLAVGAVNGKKIPWTGTQRAPYVAVAAPGTQVGSIWRGEKGWGDRRFGKSSGTSAAAALTSGAIALIRAKNPNLSARQVVQRVYNTAIDAGPRGHDVYTGNGVVIPYRAMTQDVAASAPNPPYGTLDKYLAANRLPPISKTGQQSKPAAVAKKKSSGSGLVIAIVIVAILAVIAAAIVILLMRRRGRGSSPVVHEQPFPGGPQRPQPGPGQFPQGPGGYGGPQGPPGRPVGRPQGPPPSFGPPGEGDGQQR